MTVAHLSFTHDPHPSEVSTQKSSHSYRHARLPNGTQWNSMNAIPLLGHQNGPVLVNTKWPAALDRQFMVPGKISVGILPGHTRPASIRNKQLGVLKSSSLLTQIFGSARNPYSIFDFSRFAMFSRRPKSRYYYDHATDTYRPLGFVSRPSVRQTCGSCGKFRSPTWQASHPLAPGASSSSSICRKCRRKYTSSEESVPRRRSRRRHRHHSHHHSHHYSHRHTDSTDDSYTSREYVRPARRYRSRSRDYVRPETTKSRSREGVRIVIANQSGDRVSSDRVIPKREATTSSSVDGVRIIRRIEVIDAPRRLRCRSRLRSSGVSYTEDGGRYIDDLTRPRCHSRPRSLSRTYVEDIGARRCRSRARSPSHVAFVDDIDDPVVVTRPRSRLSRRQAIYFDGAADSDRSEEETRGRTRFSDRRSAKMLEDKGGAEHMEKGTVSRAGSLAQKEKRSDKVVEPIAENILPHSCEPSLSAPGQVESPFTKWQQDLSAADTRSWDDSYHIPTAETDYESEYDVTPRPFFPSPRRPVVSDEDQRSASRHRSFVGTTNIDSHRRSLSLPLKSGKLRREQDLKEPETPRRDRRRRFRGTDSASDSEDEATPDRSPQYHCVPSPPSPLQSPDVLADAFESMHFAPPKWPWGYDYAQSLPTQRAHRSESSPSRFESTFYHPDLYEDATFGDNVSGSYRFEAANEEYEPHSSHEEGWEPWMQYDTQAARDYDWTT
ncbi:hypothetical protein N7G274_009643 [Stereocaulon virgatum]|uniref:Uncharacterized protein n=1 Tax=Stereocaulon virgatum TaxID=373712 RepID=A0ABR3ZY62_9LECA